MTGAGRRISPSAERNRQPILEVLQRVLPETCRVLEIASGSGTHGAWFVPRSPGLTWQPTDPDPSAVESIEGWRQYLDEPRLLAPLRFDVSDSWSMGEFDAVFCANMVHISPWTSTLALFAGAATVLELGGGLVVYGPFHIDGPTGSGNARFDASLRARDPSWGIRELGEVRSVASSNGFVLDEIVEMPADNRTLVFRRGSGDGAAT